MASIQYIVSATLCLSIAYLAFRLLFDRTANFRQQRVFLILSLAISLVMPLAGFRIDLTGMFEKSPLTMHVVHVAVPGNMSVLPSAGHKDFSVYAYAAAWIYLSIAVAFIAAILLHLINILRIYRFSQKSQHGNRIILSSSKIENPFSFFHWIFLPLNIYDPEERKSIITHESIHVSQYHSIDNLVVELLAAVMWFNPLVWMMKKTFHLVHEYLADEGTLNAGVDRLRYQAFLLNRVTEESLVCLPSGFNQSLIKKRMIMMTKSKNYGRNRFRILALVPVSAVLLLIVSLLNGLFPQNARAENPKPGKSIILNRLPVSGPLGQEDTLRNRTVRIKKSTSKVKMTRNVEKIEGSNRVRIISGTDGKDSIIYIVDGKRQNDSVRINPDSIESLNVIADSMTFSKRKNMVIVTLKHPMKIERKVIVEPVEGEHGVVAEPVEGEHGIVVEPVQGEHGVVVEPVQGEHGVVVEPNMINNEQIEVEPGKVSFPEDVIYYIDGKEVSKAEVDKIKPENIESVSVYKGDGVKEAGVNKKGVGIVKIVTKKH